MSSNSNFVVKKYPLDIARELATNKIEDEEHDLDSSYFPVIVPREGSFFNLGVIVKLDGKRLKYDTDYRFDAFNIEASQCAAASIYDAIVFRRNLKGKLTLCYHLIGEPWVNRVSQIQRLYDQYVGDKRPVVWENITNKPDGFPCLDHHHYGWDIKDWGALTVAIMDTTQALLKLHSGYEARIKALVNNALADNAANLSKILNILQEESSRLGQMDQNIANNVSRLNELTRDFYAEDWVPETRTINGYMLNNNVVITNSDVNAISSSYKDTFHAGFNDELTNIGKQDSSGCRYFSSMVEFFDIPVGYHGYVGNNDSVSFPGTRGWLHKLGYGEQRATAYYIFYEDGPRGNIWTCIPRDYETYPKWIRSNATGVPGEVKAYFGSVPPYNHAFLHGQAFNTVENPECFKLFPLGRFPDARGMFLRGWDFGKNVDCEPHRGLGSYQEDKMQRLTGVFAATIIGDASAYSDGVFYDTGIHEGLRENGGGGANIYLHGETRRYGIDNGRQARTGAENTVKNITANWIIMLG